MKALCWHGEEDVRIDDIPDPQIADPRNAIVRVTSTAICGSDLHLYDGFMPTMEEGDVLGHKSMGKVVEVGRDVKKLKKGDRTAHRTASREDFRQRPGDQPAQPWRLNARLPLARPALRVAFFPAW
jgi:threonine dehydrogenase-like Zn-dependent dehydrogenase